MNCPFICSLIYSTTDFGLSSIMTFFCLLRSLEVSSTFLLLLNSPPQALTDIYYMPEIVLNKLKHRKTTSQMLFFHPHLKILFLCTSCHLTVTPTFSSFKVIYKTHSHFPCLVKILSVVFLSILDFSIPSMYSLSQWRTHLLTT